MNTLSLYLLAPYLLDSGVYGPLKKKHINVSDHLKCSLEWLDGPGHSHQLQLYFGFSANYSRECCANKLKDEHNK